MKKINQVKITLNTRQLPVPHFSPQKSMHWTYVFKSDNTVLI